MTMNLYVSKVLTDLWHSTVVAWTKICHKVSEESISIYDDWLKVISKALCQVWETGNSDVQQNHVPQDDSTGSDGEKSLSWAAILCPSCQYWETLLPIMSEEYAQG